MTAEERIGELETDLARERAKSAQLEAENTQLRQQMEQVLERLSEVEGRLAKDSHNSSKPPASDGLTRKRRSERHRSEKTPGGQLGHPGRSLMQVASPDEVVSHHPARCSECEQPLEGVAGRVKERRQVHDLPEIRLLVREHQVVEVCCPACQHLSTGHFPAGVEAPTQYGPHVQALAVYLYQAQLVPMARTCELLEEVCHCHLSEGTLMNWVQQVSARVEPTVAQIADWLSQARLQHADETGVRVGGKLHWLHVNSTRWLTHLAWHPKRGKPALDTIGIWPRFRGRAMRDRWISYDRYLCQHSICGAHLLRDCTYVCEQKHQDWAAEMHELLLDLHAAAQEWRQRGVRCVPTYERDEWVARYARDSSQWVCRTTAACQRSGPETAWAAEAECCQESLR